MEVEETQYHRRKKLLGFSTSYQPTFCMLEDDIVHLLNLIFCTIVYKEYKRAVWRFWT